MHPPRWAIVPSLAFVALLTFLTYSYLGFSSSGLSTPGVTHIVMFKWKDEADEASIAELTTKATTHLQSLKQTCTHPVHKTPYILSLTGGRDTSPEGLQDGLTHAFVLAFRSPWERDYYVRDDPEHRAFVESIGEIVDKVVVLDFEPGTF